MPAAQSDSNRSLTQHLEALHTLAWVLVGAEEAAALTERVYQHAAEVPPEKRPEDERGWLFRIMVEAREGDLDAANKSEPSDTALPYSEDSFRREVAEQTANRVLPAAFAACSIQERFVLAADVLSKPSDNVLAMALDSSPTETRSVRDRARAALRASLRDVLKGPERMLVDVALPEEALRELLRNLLIERFHSVPASLRARITELLERARTESSEELPSADAQSWASSFLRGFSRIQNWISVRGLIGGITVLLVVTLGIGGAAHLFSSAPDTSSPPSVVELSTQRAGDLQISHQTDDPDEAGTYIQETWNHRVSVPSIENASLRGVSRLSLPSDVEVPALLYTDKAKEVNIVALLFNYALVDKLGDEATLEREIRTELSKNEGLLAEQRDNHAVVLWRQRDDIFVIVSPEMDSDSLRSRIRPN